MNRLGRGYSFDALRAKILFSEGAFNSEKKRPKFERRSVDKVAEKRIGYALVTGGDEESLEVPDFLRRSTEGDKSTQDCINYGVDISTITTMIEDGLI